MTTAVIEQNPTSTLANLDNMMESPISKLAKFENVMEPPILSCSSCSSYETHQDDMNGLMGNRESNNPGQEQLHRCKMDPNTINPILPPTPKPFNDVVVETQKKHRCNGMKMSGYSIIESSDLSLLHSYQDSLDVDSNLTIKGTIVDILGIHSHCWALSWDNYFAGSEVPNKVSAQWYWNDRTSILIISSTNFFQIQNADNN